MKAETRNFTRKPIHGRAAILVPGAPPFQGRVKDVSLGGVCVLITEQLVPGTKCTVMFEAPLNGNMVKITAPAKIIYCILTGIDGFRTGLEFGQIDAANNKTLAEIML